MDRVHGMTERQLRRFVKQLVRSELEPREQPQQLYTQPPRAVDHLAGVASGAITARSGGTPGTGFVLAKKFESGEADDYANAGDMLVRVLNFGGAIGDGEYVVLHRHRESGKWIVEAGSNFRSYAVRNSDDQGLINDTDPHTVTLDTNIHREPDSDSYFSISSSIITVAVGGIYQFNWSLWFQSVSANATVESWLEEDSMTTVLRSKNKTTVTAGSTFYPAEKTIAIPVSAGKTYRLRFQETAGLSPSLFIHGNGATYSGSSGYFASLEVSRVA